MSVVPSNFEFPDSIRLVQIPAAVTAGVNANAVTGESTIASLQILTSDWQAGYTARIQYRGVIARSGSGPNLTLRLRVGQDANVANCNIIANSGAVGTGVGAQVGTGFHATSLITARTLGANGSVDPQGDLSITSTGGSPDNRIWGVPGTTALGTNALVNVSLASYINVHLTAQWSDTTIGNSVNVTQIIPEVLTAP